MPELYFDQSLPVNAERETIAKAISDHQVVVLCGETDQGNHTAAKDMHVARSRRVRAHRPYAALGELPRARSQLELLLKSEARSETWSAIKCVLWKTCRNEQPSRS